MLLSLSFLSQSFAQQKVKKVIFQAFWWDYWNENYRFGWANYLTELAPRLKAAGFNAIWIPPAYKNASPDFVGYMPFDNYDLGDKRQKGNGHPLNDRMRTRVGSKDDILRMVAVMHANGIEVIHDIVLNHNGDAGGGVNTFGASAPLGTAGAGGQDPASGSTNTASGFKNFRYVSYSTPAIDELTNDYWTRNGRWPKNYQNFFNCNSSCNDINSTYWGPDIDYTAGSVGQSSNIPTSGTVAVGSVTRAYINPVQPSGYMTNQSRDWLLWLKKQTGSDGWRWDAVKHFSLSTQETGIWHSKYNSSLTSLQAGGQDMFCVGEWIGSQNDIDNYANNIASPTAPNGVTNEKHTGTFDFGLRGYNTSGNGGLYQMVRSNGSFNMQNLPGEQQSFRFFDYPGNKRVHRSVSFVNSHDTYRPRLTSNGNFLQPLGVNDNTGWNTSSELGGNGQHLDPREPRLFAAYAACVAMDGNPLVFFEDIFDIGTTGKRYSHLPTNTTDLPIRGDIVNLMQAHQVLNFKDGDYGVPTSASPAAFYQNGTSGDHVVFERVGKAIIGVTDFFTPANNNTADQQVWVTVNAAWPAGTVLYDYSGAHGITTTTIANDKRVLISTSPVGHNISNAFGHGYSIWAPAPPNVTVTSVNDLYNYLASYNQPRATNTQQEWEMADDLGDSHCESLGQGGALPANSTNQRVAGKIYTASGQQITYFVKPEMDGTNLTISLWDLDGNKLHEVSGSTSTANPLTANYTPTYTGWVVVKVRNTTTTTASQKCWVNITYTAPAVVDTRAANNAVGNRAAIWTGNKGTNSITDCGNWEEGKLPVSTLNLVIPANASPAPNFNANTSCKSLIIENGATATIGNGFSLTVLENISGGAATINGTVRMNGTALQTISSAVTINQLEVNNALNVAVNAAVTINNELTLTAGRIVLGASNLTMGTSATITGANASRYVQQLNTAATGGSLVRQVATTSVDFPIGNSMFTPVTLTNNGTASNVAVRTFESVLENGINGNSLNTTGRINNSWQIEPSTAGANISASFSWNAANELGGFTRNNAFVARNNNDNTSWLRASANAAATGSNPYGISAANITRFRTFSVYSDAAVLPILWLDFSATLVGKKVQLNWNTGSETNNKGYEVQRSTDGNNFTTLGFVLANSNPTNFNSYKYIDEANAKKIFYRIKQIDNDGKFSFSKIAIVQLAANNMMVQVVPNPVTTTVELLAGNTLNTNNQLIISVYNTQGTLLKNVVGSFDLVRNSIKNVLNNQPAGVYHFIVSDGIEMQKIKVIRQ